MSESDEVEQGTPAQVIFASQLQRMINNERHTGAIDWLSDGQGFVIHLKKQFSDDILPRHFGPAKYTSFTRRLRRWGFERVPDSGEYRHDSFRRDTVFDLDFDGEHPAHLTTKASVLPRSLPLKKRTKWMSMSPCPVVDRPPSCAGSPTAQTSDMKLLLGPMRTINCPSRYGSPAIKNNDVKSMPELMRTIDRRKQKERRDGGATPPPAKKTAVYQGSSAIRIGTPEQNMEAAQTLACLGQQQSRREFGHLAAQRNPMEDFRLGPPLQQAYTGLERGGGMVKPQSKVRQFKQIHDYSTWYDNNVDFPVFSTLLDLYPGGDEGYQVPAGPCTLSCFHEGTDGKS